jgi:natural product biosynthesis luciferase-like monooxygenase protein
MASYTAWFVGEGSLLIQAAETWIGSGHRVLGIGSRESNVVSWAKERGVSVVAPSAIADSLRAEPFEFLFSVVNLTMLDESLITLPTKLAVNFHDGPLPRYAGVNAPVWALLNDEREYGITWHEMTREADTGAILVQRRFEVAPDETSFSLNAKCFTAGMETFRELTAAITDGTLQPVAQDLSLRTYFGFYDRPAHAQVIAFDEPAEQIERMTRALDFGTYPNPVGTPKLAVTGGPLIVGTARVLEGRSGSAPGTVLAVEPDGVVVATASKDVLLSGLRRVSGEGVTSLTLSELGVRTGSVLPVPDADARERLRRAAEQAAKSEGYFVRRFADLRALELSASTPDAAGADAEVRVDVPRALHGQPLAAWVLAFLARFGGAHEFDVAYADPALRERRADTWDVFASEIPVRVRLAADASVSDAVSQIDAQRRQELTRFPYARDLFVRQPRIKDAGARVALLVDVEAAAPAAGTDYDVCLFVDSERHSVRVQGAAARVSAAWLRQFGQRFSLFLENAARRLDTPLRAVPLVSDAEEQRLNAFNDTARAVDDACIHRLFEAQVARTPTRPAVSSGGVSLTYRELDARANALAHALRARGIGPDSLVGIYLDRSVHLLVAVLGVLKAGGAYVPLDPEYPAERLAFMIEDAKLQTLLSDRARQAQLPPGTFKTLVVDGGEFEQGAPEPPASGALPHHLAYVIYTSGSTGKPKGVMLEHRNVVNFFAGMAEIFGANEAGTWLAVTSLSFDISVLELLAPVTRGYHVVIAGADGGPQKRPLDFSLFYFSANSRGGGPEHYRLLLEGARFADQNGFAAVWTPERHFHSFGGLYPNPSVASAALAMVTQRVAIRAGSCVSPLHTPLRIAEEWALVDNLSNGRVGISFASGWQPNDFALRPQNFARRQEQMYEDIEVVRKLWRGESVAFDNGVGKPVQVSVLPRPVQAELPVWVTAAGNPETFKAAGRIGANLLTHLLGQTLPETQEKIRLYREARKQAGHAGEGTVTLMLHTFVGDDEEAVKNAVRAPMKEYLQTAVGLIKEAAWSFPTFKQKSTSADGSFSTDGLSPEEMDAVLEHAFLRYYDTSGLFGSEQSALAMVEKVRAIGVDEIACLIDFGVSTEEVLAHLPHLARVLTKSSVPRDSAPRESLGELFERHPVTHFQCTPSMATMLVTEEPTRRGLARLESMLVGGEAFPPPLAKQLHELVGGRLFNMYGPTETTIWSSYQVVERPEEDIPIGRPITNTDMLLLDRSGGVVPPGEPGELCIGGKGVARGYLGRPELTDERFIAHPLRAGERIYRTGDLAVLSDEGVLRFKGRLDHQVKVRGYRIELGEIEARLGEHPHVRECAVIVREDVAGDKRIVAYLVTDKTPPSSDDLRRHLAERVPEYMVPAAYVTMGALPLTPNKKIDRKALPRPEAAAPQRASTEPKQAPGNALEELIGGVWREVLGLPEVSVNDNFFDLGGHSLLTIQVLGRLKPRLERPVSLVDLFRYPTIKSLATFLGSAEQKNETLDESAARGAERQRLRRAMADRRRS